jgi:hypothetical protein
MNPMLSSPMIRATAITTLTLILAMMPVISGAATAGGGGESEIGLVQCASLIYSTNKTSVCFSAKFLEQLSSETSIAVAREFVPVRAESAALFDHPFAIMTGEGSFTLTAAQRQNLRDYLTGGGFVVASAGCSSVEWAASFRKEIARVFPEVQLVRLDFSHPVFHTVHDMSGLVTKRARHQAHLEALTIDGRVVLIFSPDGLNDTANAGGTCCCCGGDEVLNARQMNANLLAYALTH